MANLTLVRRDSYLDHLKQGVKPDTFSALRNCPLNGHALFPDAVIRKAEDEINQHVSVKRTFQPGPGHGGFAGGHKKGQVRYQPYSTVWKAVLNLLATLAKTCQPGKALEVMADPAVGVVEVHLTVVPKAPRTIISTNDNYCVKELVVTTRSWTVVLTETPKTVNVNCSVASLVHFATNIVRQPQKRLKSSFKKQGINKICELCFFCRSLCFCPNVPNATMLCMPH